MKSPLTTSLRKQTPLNKKTIPYMTANKSKFTYMKNLLVLFLFITNFAFAQELDTPKEGKVLVKDLTNHKHEWEWTIDQIEHFTGIVVYGFRDDLKNLLKAKVFFHHFKRFVSDNERLNNKAIKIVQISQQNTALFGTFLLVILSLIWLKKKCRGVLTQKFYRHKFTHKKNNCDEVSHKHILFRKRFGISENGHF